MKLIIAEKPELGRDIAKALIPNAVEQKGCIKSNDYCITWAFGHLLELQEPENYDKKYEKWNEEYLPIWFENWKKIPAQDRVNKEGKVIIDNKYKRSRLSQIGNLLKETNYVIHAGDPDEEGQNLIDEILEFYQFKGTVKRVFINDNIPKNIIKAFQNLIDNETQKAVSASAYARQMSDKCHGINHSRLACLRLNQYGLSIGRVQTATLGLVVNRDEAIQNHVKQKYYGLLLDCKLQNKEQVYDSIALKFVPSKCLAEEDKYISDVSTLSNIKHTLQSNYEGITSVEEKIIKAPLPYNQTILAADMNRLYGYSLKETLDITQSLRDKHKAITYNRSDSQYLKTEHFQEAVGVTKCIMRNLNCELPVSFDKKPDCFNDELVTSHHGIIPQEKEINLSQLTEKERNVYIAIAHRYLMQFMKPVITKISKTVFHVEQGKFIHTGRKIINLGWKEYFRDDTKEEQSRYIEEGVYAIIVNNANIIEKETKPLPHYTQGTLVKDMTSISKYVKDPVLKQALKEKDKGKKGENGSIGTVATRSTIIETLLKRNFLEEKGKNIISTDLGKEFYHLIPNEIKTAEITAKWYLIQENIKMGELDVNELMKEDVKEFNSIRKTAYLNGKIKSTGNKESNNQLGNCPICGNPVYKSKKGNWYCNGYKNGCKLVLYERIKRFNDIITLTDKKVETLLNGGKILTSLTGKNGKTYKAYLKLDVSTGYANLKIDGYPQKKIN